MIHQVFGILFLLLLSISASAKNSHEFATENYFQSIKNNPQKLMAFLENMPKGADLHNHPSGASMAEKMIGYAKGDGLCINPKTYAVDVNPACSVEYLLDNVSQHPELYNAIIDAWSMRNFYPRQETSHDHFFAAFAKFSSITREHSGQILSEVVERAGEQNESYLELMITADNNASGMLGKKLGWNADFMQMREKLLSNDLGVIVKEMNRKISNDETVLNSLMHCDTPQAKVGCHVKVRYLYQVLREQPPEQIFAQLLAGFEIASKDKRVLGINLVQPEDGPISMRDYELQMHMIQFLHHLYPNVNISLHAGELIPGLVTPDGLRFHIRDAVEIAKAKRIGHGIDINHEDNYQQALDVMAKKHILVEINLSSNAAILGVAGDNHPILLYTTRH